MAGKDRRISEFKGGSIEIIPGGGPKLKTV